MKRWWILGLVMVLILAVAGLQPVDNSGQKFAGEWYCLENETVYFFEDGIISCEDQNLLEPGDPVFSGAYTYAGRKAALFVKNENGVGTMREVYLVRKFSGDLLCEHRDGAVEPVFSRKIQ